VARIDGVPSVARSRDLHVVGVDADNVDRLGDSALSATRVTIAFTVQSNVKCAPGTERIASTVRRQNSRQRRAERAVFPTAS